MKRLPRYYFGWLFIPSEISNNIITVACSLFWAMKNLEFETIKSFPISCVFWGVVWVKVSLSLLLKEKYIQRRILLFKKSIKIRSENPSKLDIISYMDKLIQPFSNNECTYIRFGRIDFSRCRSFLTFCVYFINSAVKLLTSYFGLSNRSLEFSYHFISNRKWFSLFLARMC